MQNGKKFIVSDKTYTIIKATKLLDSCFAMINDGREITLIMEQWSRQSDLFSKDIIDMDRDWRLITFDMELDFEIVGFIAKIAQALAKENISIFVISAYTTDHILIKQHNLDKTIEVLNTLGFTNTI